MKQFWPLSFFKNQIKFLKWSRKIIQSIMQNLMQKILHAKAFSVKPQSYGLYKLILTF